MFCRDILDQLGQEVRFCQKPDLPVGVFEDEGASVGGFPGEFHVRGHIYQGGAVDDAGVGGVVMFRVAFWVQELVLKKAYGVRAADHDIDVGFFPEGFEGELSSYKRHVTVGAGKGAAIAQVQREAVAEQLFLEWAFERQDLPCVLTVQDLFSVHHRPGLGCVGCDDGNRGDGRCRCCFWHRRDRRGSRCRECDRRRDGGGVDVGVCRLVHELEDALIGVCGVVCVFGF